MPEIELEMRVQYSARWLRSTGQLTGPVPFRKGTVRGLETTVGPGVQLQVAVVDWDDGALCGEGANRVLTCNLWPVGRPEVD